MATPIFIAGPQTPQTGGGNSVRGDVAGDAAAFSALLDLLTSGALSQDSATGLPVTPEEQSSAAIPPASAETSVDSAKAGETEPVQDPMARLLSGLQQLIDKLGSGELNSDELDAALDTLNQLASALQSSGELPVASGANIPREPVTDLPVQVKNEPVLPADADPRRLALLKLAELAQKLETGPSSALESVQTVIQKLRDMIRPANPLPVHVATHAATTAEAPDLAVQPTGEQLRQGQQPLALEQHSLAEALQNANSGQSGTNTGDRGQNPSAQMALLATRTGTETTDTPDHSKPASDPLLSIQTGQTARADALATLRPALAAYGQQGQMLNVPQIGLEIARQVQNGSSRFQIQLDPPELGRIDVRMDLDNNGSLNARLTVDRAETLDMLQRDARALERALSQAGLDGSKTNLEFALRQDAQGRQDSNAGDDFTDAFDGLDGVEGTEAEIPPIIQHRGALSPGGISLWV